MIDYFLNKYLVNEWFLLYFISLSQKKTINAEMYSISLFIQITKCKETVYGFITAFIISKLKVS